VSKFKEIWAESSEGKTMSEWQPIETAPKDKIVLLFRPTAFEWGSVAPGKYNVDFFAKRPKPFWEIWLKIGGTVESRLWEPTHWMPLPAPPKETP
jgi:hypothetical protein